MEQLHQQILDHNKRSEELHNIGSSVVYQFILTIPEDQQTEQVTNTLKRYKEELEEHERQEKLLKEAREMAMNIKKKSVTLLQSIVPEAVSHYKLDECID